MTRFVGVTIVSPGCTVERYSARSYLGSDGGRVVLKRGQAALITGGSFYQRENTGSGPMTMMGNRSGPAENIQINDYVTRKNIRRRQSPNHRHISGTNTACNRVFAPKTRGTRWVAT